MGLKERLKKLRDDVILALKPAQESIIEIAKRERSVQERFPTGFEETGIPTSKEFKEGFRAVGGGSGGRGTSMVSERTGLNALEIARAQERLRQIEIAEQQKKLREKQIRKIEEAQRKAKEEAQKRLRKKEEFKVKGQIFTRQQLINLGSAEGGITRMGGETSRKWEARLVGRGRGVAFASPTGARTFVKGGAFVSQSTLDDLKTKRGDILKNIGVAGREGRGKDLQNLRKDLREINNVLERIGGIFRQTGGKGGVVDKKLKETIKSFLVGELGEKFIGVRVIPRIGLPGAIPDITARQIKDVLRKRGLPSKVIATFIPTTPAEVALFGGVAALGGGFGGKFIQAVTSVTLTGLGLKASLTKKLPPEERIAGGLIALAGLISGASLLRFKKPLLKIKKSLKLSDLTNKIEVTKGKVKTPLSRTFQREVKFQINDFAVKKFVSSRLNKAGINFNKLSKIEQNFITGQVKAKIRTQPELFLPKRTQNLIKKIRVKNLREFTRRRLRGQFDTPISFRIKRVGKIKKVAPRLTSTQKLALKRFSQRVEGKRLRKVILKNLDKRLKNELDLLTPKQKKLIVSQIKAKIKADPTLTLSKVQKIALNKIKRVSELERITGLTKKRLRGELPEKIQLTSKQKGIIEAKLKTLLRSQPEKFIPKERRLALKRFRRTQEKKIISRAIKKGARKLKPSDLLSKSDKIFFVKQVQARARASPQLLIPKTRQVALQVLKPKLKAKKITVFTIKSKGLTSIQKLALKRQRQIFKQINRAQKIQKKAISIKVKKPIVKVKQAQKLLQKQKQKTLKQRQVLRQRTTARQKEATRLKTKLKSLQIQKGRAKTITLLSFKTKQIQKVRQKLILVQRDLQGFRTLQKNNQKLEQSIKQISLQKELQLLKQKERQRLITTQRRIRKKGKAIIPTRRRKRKIPKPSKLKIGYNVWGKRLKGRKIKGKKRKVVWIKLNVKPLSKKNALNRGSYAVDHSLSRQYKIKKVKRVKKRGKLTKKESKYFRKSRKKFRKYKIRKGIKKPLTRRYIERGGKGARKTYLLDTPGERRKITIARLSKQLNKPIKRKKVKKIVRRKITRVIKKPTRRIIRRPTRKSLKRITRSRPRPIKKPKRFIKGSKEAKDFMAKLRAMKRG